MKDYLNDFDVYWKRFITNLRGKLNERAKTQPITVSTANMVLKEVSASWLSQYDVIGKWLIEYTKQHPEKGDIIKDILKNNLKFTTEVKQKTMSSYLKYGIPLAGAIIGGGIARAFSSNLIVLMASTVVPGIGLYMFTKEYESNTTGSGQSKTLDDYMSQLEKYKVSIQSVLQN